MDSLHLEIITPDSRVLNTTASYVGAPGVKGRFGVLPGHLAMLSTLEIGAVHYVAAGKTYYVFVSGGIAEVENDKVTILTETAESAENIDFARAQRAAERARQRLAARTEHVNEARAEMALTRALVRLSLQKPTMD